MMVDMLSNFHFFSIVALAVKAYIPYVIGKSLVEIFENFSLFWRSLVNHGQLRWVMDLSHNDSKHGKSDILHKV